MCSIYEATGVWVRHVARWAMFRSNRLAWIECAGHRATGRESESTVDDFERITSGN